MIASLPDTEQAPHAAAPLDDDVPRTNERRRKHYRARLKEQQTGNARSLTDILKGLRDDYRRRDYEPRRKHNEDVDMMFRYFSGDQYGDYDEAGNYVRYTRTEGDFAYTVPVLVGHAHQAFSQLGKIRPTYEFNANRGTNPLMRDVATMSEELAVADFDRMMTFDCRHEERWNTVLAGESWRELVWAPDPKRPRKVKRPVYVTEEVPTPAYAYCEACRAQVPPGSKQCPECRATYVKETPPGKASRTLRKGTREITLGQNRLVIPHVIGVQRDLSAKNLDDSPFVIVRDTLPKARAEWAYQTQIITGSHGISEDSQLIHDQARATMQSDGIVGSARPVEWGMGGYETVERSRHFLDPSEYGWIYVEQEETLPSGRKIPAGFLGDSFPAGLYFNFVGDTLVECEPVCKWRKWLLVRYGRRPGTGRGAGIMIARPLQDIANDTFNLWYSTVMTTGHPLTVVNRKLAPDVPDANNLLYIDKADIPAQNAVYRVPGAAADASVPATADRIETAMQFILGTHSLMGNVGAPDQRSMGTATGIAAAVENTSSRFGEPSEQVIGADEEFLLQILENIQEYTKDVPEQRREYERRFGPETVAAFYECNFRLDLAITVKTGTERPRSVALTQAGMLAIAQVAPALAQVPWGADLIMQMMEEFGAPLEIGQGRTDRRAAEHILNKLQALAEMAPKDGSDAETAAQMYDLLVRFCGPLVAPAGETPDEKAQDIPYAFMLEHVAWMEVYKEALQSDEAKTWTNPQRLVVIRLWQDHFDAIAMAEFQKQAVQARMQAVVNPQPPPPPTPSPEEVEAARGAAVEDDALRREGDELAKDVDFERQEAAREAEHRRELERTAFQAELKGGEQPQNGANA